MDNSIQRALNDKIYDKRKQGALELEGVIRDCLAAGDYKKIAAIVDQLCHDFAYAWQQPHARNGGLIGLAAAAIALGSDHVAQYLSAIVPPVLACFTDQDARVRYYACESMYNIAKVAKGEILVFFNDVFDALCKLAADSELSVKNGAELLDRLIKDIVSESAATYVSSVAPDDEANRSTKEGAEMSQITTDEYPPMAFSLAKFIPLLRERIYVINPFTRSFLVAWVLLLDSIPDLELVTYLPDFLGGFLKFLNDSNHDVRILTKRTLDRFLNEIKRIDKIKQDIAESKRSRPKKAADENDSNDKGVDYPQSVSPSGASVQDAQAAFSGEESDEEGDWIPGQDTYIDYRRILQVLVDSLDQSAGDEIRLTALHWIDAFFDICPEEILQFVPSLLSHVLPAMASTHESLRQAASSVNASLMDYVSRLPDEDDPDSHRPAPLSRLTTSTFKTAAEQPASASSLTLPTPENGGAGANKLNDSQDDFSNSQVEQGNQSQTLKEAVDLDYRVAVGALTLHFLADHEATRVAALNWLILLHRKAPRKVLATNDGTFPALLKTLSDPDEAVVTKDLQLLAQISRNSDDSYFSSFIENVLQLFGTDRKLLEQRGNLIIRQLCGSLNAERIYRTMADCLEREEDFEFATIMVQSLNNNLITAPQLAELRKRLRYLDNRDGQTLFVTLFRSWCYNAVATFSLCLLAQAYEQAYQLLLIIGELETTVQMLIEIDKLVQLLESPVFTYLRLQLLEPERYPYLYKCLHGVLMLLPQSAAFAALKNRLGSVSAVGYLHTPGRPVGPPSFLANSSFSGSASNAQQGRASGDMQRVSGSGAGSGTQGSSGGTGASSTAVSTSVTSAVAAARHKSRDEGAPVIRWPDLLEKFRIVQERARRLRKGPHYFAGEGNDEDSYHGDLPLRGPRAGYSSAGPLAGRGAGSNMGATGYAGGVAGASGNGGPGSAGVAGGYGRDGAGVGGHSAGGSKAGISSSQQLNQQHQTQSQSQTQSQAQPLSFQQPSSSAGNHGTTTNTTTTSKHRTSLGSFTRLARGVGGGGGGGSGGGASKNKK